MLPGMSCSELPSLFGPCAIAVRLRLIAAWSHLLRKYGSCRSTGMHMRGMNACSTCLFCQPFALSAAITMLLTTSLT